MKKPVLLLVCATVATFGLSAFAEVSAAVAEPKASTQKKKAKKKKAGLLTEGTYKRLVRIHDFIGESNYEEALRRLDSLWARLRRNEYEKSVVLQTYGFVWASKNNFPKALEYMERSYQLDALPEEPTRQLVYNIAQLNMAIKRFRKGIRVLEEWFKTAENPSGDAHALAGIGYANLDEFRNAIPHMKKAVKLTADPKEEWFQLLLAMHYELKQYPESAGVLGQMVRRWPENEKYWKQLSGILLALKDGAKSLSVLELAYQQGLLKKGREIERLANMYLYQEIPYKAGQVLERGLKDGLVEPKKKNWELLGNAWMAAKENTRAIAALKKAAPLAKDGKIHLRVAFLYLQEESWKQSAAALKLALKKGGLKNAGNAYVMLGMTAYETKDYEGAIGYFERAQKFEKSRKQATEWINHVLSEQAVFAEDS